MITPNGVHTFVGLLYSLWLLGRHKYQLIRLLKGGYIRSLNLCRIEIGCFHFGYLIMRMID
jgi:hypothetical protein